MDNTVLVKLDSNDSRIESKVIANDLQYLVGIVREHLGLDIAFIAKYDQGRRVFEYVDSKTEQSLLKPNDSDPLDETYCFRITEGDLPEIMTDTHQYPDAHNLPVTEALQIKSYIGVPIRTADGKVYGTFCCFGHQAEPGLGERELALLKIFAELAGKQIDQKRKKTDATQLIEDRILSVIESLDFEIAYQPIYDLTLKRVVGYESLSRFHAVPYTSPDLWFKEAANVGLGEVLENLATQKALKNLERLPPEVYLSINTSPDYIINGSVGKLLEHVPGNRIVLEITEHARISNYDVLRAALLPLRERGIRLAIDDAGAGYASFQHILELKADIIKLDISLIHNINTDCARRALTTAIITFANNTGCEIVAEGIETEEEFETLSKLGARNAQGYFIGRPMPVGKLSGLEPFKLYHTG